MVQVGKLPEQLTLGALGMRPSCSDRALGLWQRHSQRQQNRNSERSRAADARTAVDDHALASSQRVGYFPGQLPEGLSVRRQTKVSDRKLATLARDLAAGNRRGVGRRFPRDLVIGRQADDLFNP